MTSQLTLTSGIADCMKLSCSMWFYWPFDVLTDISQYLLEVGQVPELVNTDNSVLQVRWSKASPSAPNGISSIFFDRIGREAPMYGSGFGGPVEGNFIPNMSFSLTNVKSDSSSGPSILVPNTWNQLAFSADWSVGDRWGFSQSPGYVPFQIHSLWTMVLNGLDTSIATRPNYNPNNWPLKSNDDGDKPNWNYANNDGYGGEPLPDITSRTYAMDLNGAGIGVPFNDNDPPTLGKNSQGLIFASYMVWFNKYIDWSDGDNLSKVVTEIDNNLYPVGGRVAADAFGVPDIWLERDSISGVKFEDNQGTAGDFEVVGVAPVDFSPDPNDDPPDAPP